jgi:N-acetyl-alpha-D-muramate 1-phosphate uridylyltransferase
MQAVVLAGGLATRMRPMTLTTPKSMLPVAGRPFIDWQLAKLRECGFADVLLCTGHLGEQIEAHVGAGERHGLRVRYSREEKLLGTAGALRLALPLLEPLFLVTYGDSYLPFDYAGPLRELERHDDCDAVMSIYRNEGQGDASNVTTDGEWVLRYEKGTEDPAFVYIDYGAIAVRRAVVAALPPDVPSGLDRIQGDLARARRLRAHIARDKFFEIGSKTGLDALDAYLRSKDPSS